MTIPPALRGVFLVIGIGFAGLRAGGMGGAQAPPPLNSQWSPGAIPGGGGIAVPANPIVTPY
jgi:hypothetical protein